MKHKLTAFVLAFVLLLSGCMNAVNDAADVPVPEDTSSTSASASGMEPATMAAVPEAEIPLTEVSDGLTPFESDTPLSLEETVREYFNQHYRAYVSLAYIDLDYFLDMEVSSNQNLITWTKALLQRRRLLQENDLCYVDTTVRSYEIVFDEQPEDAFFSNMRGRGIAGGGDTAVYFHITGDKGEAYPLIMAMNAQHTMILRQVDGHWKITMHYFPGAVRKFLFGAPELVSEEVMLAALREEFAPAADVTASQIPSYATAYNAEQAAAYARQYTESKNPVYYNIGDFRGNCANFVSQCLSAGLDDRYTSDWFGGSGGGSPPWETARYLWDYLTGSGGIQGEELFSPTQLQAGDIIMTKSRSSTRGNDGYSHTLIVVDADTLKLGQNTPACFVYWSDLLDVEYGLYRPEYLS